MVQGNRRRYRFRAWHKSDRNLYPVIWYGRGGLRVQDGSFEKTCALDQVVLMQYTGVVDIAGQEIYEGDIVESIEEPGHKERARVDLDDGSFRRINLATEASRPLSSEAVRFGHLVIVGDLYQSVDRPGKNPSYLE